MASNSKKAAHAEKKRALLETKKVHAPAENNPGLTRTATDSGEDRPKLSALPDLPRVIEESKARLEAEGPTALKRGRGRPPGPKAAAAPDPAPEAPASSAGPSEHDVSLAPMISDGLQAFYAQRAASTGFDGFIIQREKADFLAGQAEACAQVYFPQLSEKGSLLAVTLLSWAMHMLGTELGYKRFAAAKRVEQIKQNAAAEQASAAQPRASGLGVFPSSMAQ